eukprot:403344380
MFQIPLKLGKNNEIESGSEFGGLTTRRGANDRFNKNQNQGYSGRSYDQFAGDSIFDDRLIGSNGKILGLGSRGSNYKRNDIIEIQSNNDIPFELLGDTGLHDFDIDLKQDQYNQGNNHYEKYMQERDQKLLQNQQQNGHNSNKLLYNLQKTINLTISPGDSVRGKEDSNEGNFNMKTLHMSDLEPTDRQPLRIPNQINKPDNNKNSNELTDSSQNNEISGVRDMYQEYIKNKFSKKRVNDNNMLDQLLSKKNVNEANQENGQMPNTYKSVRSSYEDNNKENNGTQAQESASVRTSAEYVSLRSKKPLLQKTREQLDSYDKQNKALNLRDHESRISGHELKDKLKEIMDQIKQTQLQRQFQNPLDITLDVWNKIESQEDFFQIFQKIKENMILLQNKCQDQEDRLILQENHIKELESDRDEHKETVKQQQYVITNLKEQLQQQQVKQQLEIDRLNQRGQEQIIQLQAQLDSITTKSKKIQQDQLQEIDQLTHFNQQLILKLSKGKEKYEKVCKKFKDLKNAESNTKCTIGGLIKTVTSYNSKTVNKQGIGRLV